MCVLAAEPGQPWPGGGYRPDFPGGPAGQGGALRN